MIAIGAIVAVTTATIGLGIYGVRIARTTSDLFVASRAVTPWWNAAAISGEYLSAASFLGIAGLQMKLGSGALWLPLGFTAGYLALLLFVAAPLRRFGAYTISDFAEARLRSPRIRVLAACVVLGIAGFYLVPQLKGAGLTLGEVTGAPYWVGVAAVGAIVAGNVASGGMRGITYVQAFQYWTKTFAIALPACLLLLHLGGLPERAALFGHELPRAPASGLAVTLDDRQRVTFPEATSYAVDGRRARAAAGEERTLPAGRLTLPPRAVVPVAEGIEAKRGEDWARPVDSGGESSPVFVYSLLLATFLGTMGLPHILSASTPTRTARLRGARPCACSACWRCSTRSRSCTGRSGGCWYRSCTSRARPTRWSCGCPRRRGRGSAASCWARSSRRARSRPSCRPRRG
jgi:cation/acetate symporter